MKLREPAQQVNMWKIEFPGKENVEEEIVKEIMQEDFSDPTMASKCLMSLTWNQKLEMNKLSEETNVLFEKAHRESE